MKCSSGTCQKRHITVVRVKFQKEDSREVCKKGKSNWGKEAFCVLYSQGTFTSTRPVSIVTRQFCCEETWTRRNSSTTSGCQSFDFDNVLKRQYGFDRRCRDWAGRCKSPEQYAWTVLWYVLENEGTRNWRENFCATKDRRVSPDCHPICDSINSTESAGMEEDSDLLLFERMK